MIKKMVFYVVGIAVLGWIIASLTSLVIGVLPYVSVGILMMLPFYGMIRNKMKLHDQKFGVKRFAVSFAGFFKFNKRSWTFYLILGVAIGFAYEDIIWKMVETLSWSLTGLVVFWVIWETTRLSIRKFSKTEIVSFRHAVRSSW